MNNINEPNRLFGYNQFVSSYQKGGFASHYYVDARAFPRGNGSPSRPFNRLKDVFDVINDKGAGNYYIYLGRGTYKDQRNGGLEDFGDIDSYSFVATVNQNLYIKGGYAGRVSPGLYDWIESSRVLGKTIVDGKNSGSRLLYFHRPSSIFNPVRADLFIEGITFRHGEGGDGGAVYCDMGGYQKLDILDCIFEDNASTGDGGALWVTAGGRKRGTILRCDFRRNSVDNWGGALRVSSDYQSNGMYITGCLFEDNEATSGGAVVDTENRYNTYIASSTFLNNNATDRGGAFATQRKAKPEFSKCRFINNVAGDHGSAFGSIRGFNNLKAVKFDNCLLHNNVGSESIFHSPRQGPYVRMRYCTIADNPDGGVYAANNGRIDVVNCILSNNGPFGLKTDNSGSSDYNDVYGHTTDYDGLSAGANDISVDPLFVDAGNDDYHLQGISPCIGVGTSVGITDDLDGNTRVGFDLGCYES